MSRSMQAILPAALLCLIAAAGGAQPSAPPPAQLIDRVIADTNISARVSLALDNGYGVGLEPWDGRHTEIRHQVMGRQVDVNGDHEPEWLVIVASHVTCNETGLECRLLVYSGQKDGYRRLWAAYRLGTGPTIGATQLGEVRAGPGQSNGWLDLSWSSARPSNRGTAIQLKYDGQAYR